MRRGTAIFAAVILSACSSATPTTSNPPPPPPPPAPGAATSVAIVAGDGQSGFPAAALPLKLSVVVKDASGTVVPGVVVHFSADSGGGSVDLATATTGTDGIAKGVTWTLGPAVGTNVVTATVSATVLVRFHASASIDANRTLITSANVGTSGGTLTYSQPGDPLNGLTLTVPAGSYHQSTQWTISAAPASVTLPGNAFVIGSAITVTNGQGYADSLIGLRIPVHAGADTALAAFFYDPGSGTLEMVPIAGRDTGGIVIASRHFSADQMVYPASSFPSTQRARGSFMRPAPAPVIAQPAMARALPGWGPARPPALARFMPSLRLATPAFGSVTLVVVGLTQEQLAVPINTSFAPGTDDWEFVNDGWTWLSPTGTCAGMTVSALYYNYRYKAANGSLFQRFDRLPGFSPDNPRGIRLAAVAQDRYDFQGQLDFERQIQQYAVANGVARDVVNYNSLLLAMYVTGRAQFLVAYRPGGSHAVIAYGSQGGTIRVANPNFPGVPQTASYVAGAFQPYQASDYAGSTGYTYNTFEVFGVSALIGTGTLDSLWQSFAAGTVGSSDLPHTTLEAYDPIAATWGTVTSDTIHVATDTLMLRTNCSNCAYQRVGSPLPARQLTTVYDALGTWLMADSVATATGVMIPLMARKLVFGVESAALNKVPGLSATKFYYVDFHWLTVIKTSIAITPRAIAGPVDSTYKFTASNGGNLAPGSTFNWVVTGGGTSTPYTVMNDSVLSVMLNALGNWKIKVTLKDPSGTVLGVDSTGATTYARPLHSLVSVGGGHSAAVFFDGTIRAWGADGYGQLGDGDTVDKVSPTNGPNITGAMAVSVGGLATAVLMNDGTVRTFGLNNFGVLGDGNSNQLSGGVDAQHAGPGSAVPVGLAGVIQVVSSGYHMMALRNDGTVWFWGNGQDGEVGNGGQGSPNAPQKIPNLSNVIAIASTVASAAALEADGTVWTWGGNSTGQLGDNFAESMRTTPAQVQGLPRVVALMASGGYTVGQEAFLAIAADSTVWAWGGNGFGQLGNGQSQTNQPTPTQVPGLHGVIEVAGGTYNSLALKADGTVWAWGDNTYGQLGDGSNSPHLVPAQVPGLSGIGGIAVDDGVSAAWSRDGLRVYMWGLNDHGQLGLGTSASSVATPTQLFGMRVPPTP